MAESLSQSSDQLAVLRSFPELLNETHRTRTEKLDNIIGNLEGYRAETKKNIIAQAILEKNSTASNPPGNNSSTEASSGSTSHIPESNAIASELRTRWEPGSGKPTIKSTREPPPMAVHQKPESPLSTHRTLAGKTIARLDVYDRVSASSLDKFYKSKERSRRDSAQWSAGGSSGSDAATPVVGNGDPRLFGRMVDYDASRDPRLRR